VVNVRSVSCTSNLVEAEVDQAGGSARRPYRNRGAADVEPLDRVGREREVAGRIARQADSDRGRISDVEMSCAADGGRNTCEARSYRRRLKCSAGVSGSGPGRKSSAANPQLMTRKEQHGIGGAEVPGGQDEG